MKSVSARSSVSGGSLREDIDASVHTGFCLHHLVLSPRHVELMLNAKSLQCHTREIKRRPACLATALTSAWCWGVALLPTVCTSADCLAEAGLQISNILSNFKNVKQGKKMILTLPGSPWVLTVRLMPLFRNDWASLPNVGPSFPFLSFLSLDYGWNWLLKALGALGQNCIPLQGQLPSMNVCFVPGLGRNAYTPANSLKFMNTRQSPLKPIHCLHFVA